MRPLQQIPGDSGGIHPAAEHRDHVGEEHESQRPVLQDLSHEGLDSEYSIFAAKQLGAGTDSDCDIIRLGMVHRRSRVRWGSAVLIFVTVLAFATDRRPARSVRPIRNAFYANQELQVQPVVEAGARNFNYGPWTLGSLVRDDNASDRRFNLYIIVPGAQHQSPPPGEEFNHSVLINSDDAPGDRPTEWDVFWVVVLDPSLNREIKDERELLLLGQSYFLPADLYDVEDAPGQDLLRQLSMTSLNDLSRFRRSDGALPRVILLSAGAAVRMNVAPPPAE